MKPLFRSCDGHVIYDNFSNGNADEFRPAKAAQVHRRQRLKREVQEHGTRVVHTKSTLASRKIAHDLTYTFDGI
jgi:hypothetical protein